MNPTASRWLLALVGLPLVLPGCQKSEPPRQQAQSEATFIIPAPPTQVRPPAPVIVQTLPPTQPEAEPKLPPHQPRPKPPDIPPEKRTVAEWLKQLRHPELGMQEQALNALVVLGEKSVPGLIKELEKPANERSRVLAIRGLGRIGPKAKEAVPALKKAMDDHDPDIRYHSKAALERIVPGT